MADKDIKYKIYTLTFITSIYAVLGISLLFDIDKEDVTEYYYLRIISSICMLGASIAGVVLLVGKPKRMNCLLFDWLLVLYFTGCITLFLAVIAKIVKEADPLWITLILVLGSTILVLPLLEYLFQRK